jgi:hypothetical protein
MLDALYGAGTVLIEGSDARIAACKYFLKFLRLGHVILPPARGSVGAETTAAACIPVLKPY